MRIGFIGSGNMSSAMIVSMMSKGFSPDEIMISNRTAEKAEKLNAKYGIEYTLDNRELVKKCDMIVLAVKPQVYEPVIKDIKADVNTSKIIITIAAGKTLAYMEGLLGDNIKIVRTMPNTPAMVGEGMTAICPNKNINEADLKSIRHVFDSFGKTETIAESLFDAVTGICGSSPAYIFMFIEAMADAAVLAGMPRAAAYRFASQAVLGAGKLALESGKHPGELKDMVCSPGGTTIVAVKALEEGGFRSAIMNAVLDNIEKSKSMSE